MTVWHRKVKGLEVTLDCQSLDNSHKKGKINGRSIPRQELYRNRLVLASHRSWQKDKTDCGMDKITRIHKDVGMIVDGSSAI